METWDISYRDFKTAPLSNLFPYSFEIDGISCASMEGFLRCLTVDDTFTEGKLIKRELCKLSGVNAYKIRELLRDWRKSQILFWQGKEIKRSSDEYQELLTKAYDKLFENILFKHVLGNVPKHVKLEHSIGHSDIHDTLLSKEEYIYQLERLQNML